MGRHLITTLTASSCSKVRERSMVWDFLIGFKLLLLGATFEPPNFADVYLSPWPILEVCLMTLRLTWEPLLRLLKKGFYSSSGAALVTLAALRSIFSLALSILSLIWSWRYFSASYLDCKRFCSCNFFSFCFCRNISRDVYSFSVITFAYFGFGIWLGGFSDFGGFCYCACWFCF
jgi:hypothetical protein